MRERARRAQVSAESSQPRSAKVRAPSSIESAASAAGNLAVQQLLESGRVRAKLRVGGAGDPAEQEADRVARGVVHGGVACTCSKGGKGTCAACAGNERTAPRRVARPDATRSAGEASQLRLGSGRPLGAADRGFFERRLDAQLGAVVLHTDDTAARAADSIGARAFSVGGRVAFARGEYRPQTTEGRLLIAHELAHLVRGHQGIRRQKGRAHAPATSFGELDPLFPSTSPSWPTMFRGLGAPAVHDQPSHPSVEIPRAPVCPGTCHQIAESHRRYAEQRMAAAERQRRLARWPELHRAQHKKALSEQARTLTEEISQSELGAAQVRVQLFSAATGAGAAHVTEEMRESWAAALQSTLFLESVLRAESSVVPEALVDSLRATYQSFFSALVGALRDRDRRDRELLRMIQSRPADPCPSCHGRPAASRGGSPSFGEFQTSFPSVANDSELSQWIRTLSPSQASPAQPLEPEPIGERERRLIEAGVVAAKASEPSTWRQVIAQFRWATGEMDRVLVAAVPQNDANRRLIEQLEYTQALLERQRTFHAAHPDAVKVRAVFYPKPESVRDFDQRTGAGGAIEDIARGIPWQFYLTRSPADRSEPFPVDFEWQLHDITAARRGDGRTVKQRHTVSNVERNVRMIGTTSALLQHPPSLWVTDPPDTLFAELDHKDFFPEGHLYWEYPSFSGDGRQKSGQVQTNASRTFWEWVGLIGMSVAILGSLVFAPFSTPMLVAVAAGTGLSILGNYMRLREMREHGVATERDTRQFYWGVALDILSALTLGVGRVVAVAARAGQTARAAAASRVWFALQRTELAGNIANVGVAAYDFLAQYRAIEASNMSPEEKRKALEQLTVFGLIGGTLSIVPVAMGFRDLRRGSTLHLVPDPRNPGRTIGRFDPDAADSAQLVGGRAPNRNAELIGSIRGQGANRSHTYGVWSDGRITRCSKAPCPDIAESVIGRVDPLRARMLPASAHAERVRDLAETAHRLRLEAAQAASSPETLRAAMGGLQRRARELDDAMTSLERDVLRESLDALRGRLPDSSELDRLLGRRLPAELGGGLEDALARATRSGDYDAEHLARMITTLRATDVRDLRRFLTTRVQINRGSTSRRHHTSDSIWWGRMRSAEEVSLLEAQLRGYGPSLGRERRAATGARGRTLAEASTPEGQHDITSLIGDPMRRQGLENVLPTRSRVRDPSVREQLDIMVGERLHAIGAGLGAETATGVAHGSSFVNQVLQRQGVEDFLRFLHRNRPEGVRYMVHLDVRTRAVGRGGETRMLDRITYRVRAVEELPNGELRPLRDLGEITITHPQTIRSATRPRGRGDVQGIGIEVESGFGALAEHFGL